MFTKEIDLSSNARSEINWQLCNNYCAMIKLFDGDSRQTLGRPFRPDIGRRLLRNPVCNIADTQTFFRKNASIFHRINPTLVVASPAMLSLHRHKRGHVAMQISLPIKIIDPSPIGGGSDR